MIGYSSESELNLAALGLRSSFAGIFLLSIGISLNGSLSTLVAQSYGSSDLRMCGVYLNRQIYLNLLVTLPISILLLFSYPFFITIGISEEMFWRAAKYVIIFIPGGIGSCLQNCFVRYLAG